MNENKRLLAVFGLVILIVVIILLISLWPKPNKACSCNVKADSDFDKLGKVNYEQYECLSNLSSTNALVVSDDLSKKEKTTLNAVASEIGKVIYYLDTEKLSKSELSKAKKALQYSDNSFEKDVILAISSNKVTAYKENILSSFDELKSFADEANIAKFACNVQSDADYENLGEITYDQYQCLLENDNTFAVIIARTTCSWCQKFKPEINKYVGENALPIYIIEYDKWEENEFNSLLSSLEYFNENDSWGTPLTLAVKDKKVIAELSGYTDDESEMEAFFKEAGLK
ncbi:MAG: hypothetical protein IJ093_03295 [Bacilli bacterium]|nr:hypothetical protein [Bacilli bacterium]